MQYSNDDVDYALVNGISQEIVRKGSRIEKNVYHFGTQIKNDYIFRCNYNAMVVVSSREFRANQRKYFALARVNDVVITSRSHGSYRLVPISESDTLIDKDTLDAKIRQGIADRSEPFI